MSSMPAVDPAVAAAAAQLRQAAEQPDLQAPYGRDENGRPVVPGFTSDPVNPEPLLASEQPQQAAAQTETTSVEVPSFEADTTGIEELLELEDEIEETEPPNVVDETEDEYLDDDSSRLKAENEKLRRKIKWQDEQRIKASEKEWRAEAKRRFPLAAVETLTATSRHGLLKAAHAQHEVAYKAVKPLVDLVEGARGEVFEEARQEGRADAASRWGAPSQGPSQPMIEHANTIASDEALAPGNYKNGYQRLKALMAAGKFTGI